MSTGHRLWESPRTGVVYRVGRPGEPWEAVGQYSGGPFSSPLAYAAVFVVLAASASAWIVGLGALGVGVVAMYLPAVLPVTVPLAFVAFLVAGTRVLLTRRRTSTLVAAAVALVAFFVLAALNALYWYSSRGPTYVAIASFPTMCVLSVVTATGAFARRKAKLGLAMLVQGVTFAVPYLALLGSEEPFGASELRYDNLLALATWVMAVCLGTCWVTPARRRQAPPHMA